MADDVTYLTFCHDFNLSDSLFTPKLHLSFLDLKPGDIQTTYDILAATEPDRQEKIAALQLTYCKWNIKYRIK